VSNEKYKEKPTSPVQNLFKKKTMSAGHILNVTLNHFMVDNTFLSASGMVYTSLTAMIPAFTVFFTFFGALGVLDPFKQFLTNVFNDIVDTNIGDQIIPYLSNYTTNATSLGIVGLISFFITMVLLINRVWAIINGIYRTSTDRNIISRFANFITFAIMSVLLIAAFINFQTRFSSKYAEVMGTSLETNFFITLLKKGLPFAIMFIAIFLLIYFVPNTKVELKAAAIGSFTGTCIITIINYILVNLSNYFIKLSVIYGSFAFIFIMLVLVYLAWAVIFFSAELAFVYQFRPDLDKNNGMQHSPAIFLSEGVNIIMLIGSNFKEGKGATSTREMNERLGIPDKWLYGYLDFLTGINFIISTTNGNTTFIPSRPLDQLRVKDLVDGLYGLELINSEDRDTAGEAISIQIHAHGIASLGSLSIENLLERV
jgi:membrane protein